VTFAGTRHGRAVARADAVATSARLRRFLVLHGHRVALHRSAQHLEHDRGRPPEEQHAVHRRHGAEQLPPLHWGDVAVSERRVVDECKVHEIAAGGRRVHNRVRPGPDDYFKRMRPHQDRHDRNHHGGQEQGWIWSLLRACDLGDPNYDGHDQGMDRDVDRAHAAPQQELSQHVASQQIVGAASAACDHEIRGGSR